MDSHSFEERYFEQVQLFIPPSLAGIVVAETSILRAAAMGLFHRHRKEPQEFGYVENSLFSVLPLIILFCSPVDVVLVDLIFRLRGPLWTTLLVGADLYALAWAYGTLVSMRARPHRITDRYLYVYKGIYERAVIALDSIQSANVLPRSNAGKKEGSEDLSLRGTAKVEIRLTKPAQIIKWFRPGPEGVFSVTISADDPSGLCRAIERQRDSAVAKA